MASQDSQTYRVRWSPAAMGSEKRFVRPTSTSPKFSSPNSASLASLIDSKSSGQESPLRGNDLLSTGAHRERSKAITRPIMPDPIRSDDDLMRMRFMSGGFAAKPPGLHDSVIEPLPAEEVGNNLSELLTRSPILNCPVDLTGFSGHRDISSLLDTKSPARDAPELPLRVLERICTFLDFRAYLAVRLSCRNWSAATSYVNPPRLPSVYFLPAEILQHIYTYLSPEDFNSSRHTSRTWMVASLEKPLLSLMLKRGGWWTSSVVDAALNHSRGLQREKMSDEWLMSKRLSTESSLSHVWTGNGITSKNQNLYEPQVHRSGASTMVLTSITDFSELSDDSYNTGNLQPSIVRFTSSVCGKYLLIIEGCVIHVFRLFDREPKFQSHGGHLEQLASIICPRRVIAVSMDATRERYAVAALLYDRMGIVCNLKAPSYPRQPPNSPMQPQAWGKSNEKASAPESSSSDERDIIGQAISKVTDDCAHFQSWPITGSMPEDRHVYSNSEAKIAPSPLAILNSPDLAGVSIGYDSRSIYRGLCSGYEPPISVAICPQRRCVAFGCSSGIELHWVDALTGQDLNRWFPLARPSDFLYFLQPIQGVIESAKKLKLISSTGLPGQDSGLRGTFVPGDGRWDLMGSERPGEGEIRSPERVDYYRAVPLSDGIHILFCDPVSGRLCLGSDAPLGGPTKLTRRFTFLGPNTQGDDTTSGRGEPREITFPKVYAAGQDLRWGVRIVAGFGNNVWLYTVPPDFFGGELGISRLPEEVETVINEAYSPDVERRPFKFRGLEIGSVEGLVNVSIDASFGTLLVWAFGRDGSTYTWQIDDGQQKRARKRKVFKDGMVLDLEDADGDVIMRDAPPLD